MALQASISLHYLYTRYTPSNSSMFTIVMFMKEHVQQVPTIVQERATTVPAQFRSCKLKELIVGPDGVIQYCYTNMVVQLVERKWVSRHRCSLLQSFSTKSFRVTQ